LSRASFNFIKSLFSIAFMVSMVKYYLCKSKNYRGKMDGWGPAIGAFIGGLSICLESDGR
jgi:hypothetical protein